MRGIAAAWRTRSPLLALGALVLAGGAIFVLFAGVGSLQLRHPDGDAQREFGSPSRTVSDEPRSPVARPAKATTLSDRAARAVARAATNPSAPGPQVAGGTRTATVPASRPPPPSGATPPPPLSDVVPAVPPPPAGGNLVEPVQPAIGAVTDAAEQLLSGSTRGGSAVLAQAGTQTTGTSSLPLR